ncbi:MAG TPA: phosphatidylserine/phosphatidylglycerophosphate/cardiolipin synthase family protein [Pirellulales bacterium]|jgi:cardiolipin synthase|nr:phosphatidylserine/phosphatidylglycerophosphate/cardiolipin synthase family protein [Pirellulales bacterium]
MATHAPQIDDQLFGREPDVWPVRVGDDDFQLFCSGTCLVKAMLEDIAAARRRVWLETYIFADDQAGRAVAEALKERARAGVDVRLIYDWFGCWRMRSSLFADLEAAGVKVHAFHRFGEALLRPNLFTFFNRRDHRKLLIVDDEIAYCGGMNLVDTSGLRTVEQAREQHLPKSAGWRDLHARVLGPAAADVAGAFERLWQRAHRRRVPWPRWRIDRMLAERGDAVYFFDCVPSMKSRHARRVLCPLLRKARRNITLSMAYFLPTGAVLRELLRARKRGVKIRVIVPGLSDVRLVQWATRHFYAWLMRRGISIFERCDLMLHSKTMIIDDDWTVIGSCNLDPRSLQMNLEFIGVVRSQAMATTVKQICALEMRNSRRVTLADWRGRRWWQRWLDRAAWALRRWL